jgi:phage regulator Rha-like protein
MLDSDLAELFQVETKVLNQSIKRNIDRFPDYFRFQLTTDEFQVLKVRLNQLNLDENFLRSQIVTSKAERGGRRYLPFAFTEQGVAMLSSVLRSDVAIQTSIQIMQAFVSMRKFLLNNASVFQRLEQVELNQLKSNERIDKIFSALEKSNTLPTQGVFFDGQIFDAYELMSRIIRSAKKEIILIDNYIDESVLTHLSKRAENVEAIIYTKSISKTIKLDLEKQNSQYPPIQIKELRDSHDRFLIIDRKELYHIGASLKDLGKKWFAFSKMDGFLNEVLKKIKTSPIQF